MWGIDRRPHKAYIDLPIDQRLTLESGWYVSKVDLDSWGEPEILVHDPSNNIAQPFCNSKTDCSCPTSAHLPSGLDCLGNMLEDNAYLI